MTGTKEPSNLSPVPDMQIGLRTEQSENKNKVSFQATGSLVLCGFEFKRQLREQKT